MITSSRRATSPARPVALVLDLDLEERDNLVAQLDGLGYRALRASGLSEARRLVETERPAFVFVACGDFALPCRELARALLPEGGAMPRVVGLCAAHDSCGLDETLPKPVPLEAMRSLLSGDKITPEKRAPERTPAEALRDLDPAIFTALLQVFEEDTAARLQRIAAALEVPDLRLVDREAHAIKSGCLQIGADAMSGCCELLRAAAQASDLGLARQAYDELVLNFCETMAVSTPLG